jgi:hypothetical protein
MLPPGRQSKIGISRTLVWDWGLSLAETVPSYLGAKLEVDGLQMQGRFEEAARAEQAAMIGAVTNILPAQAVLAADRVTLEKTSTIRYVARGS